MLSVQAGFRAGREAYNIRKGGIFMRYFKVDVQKEPTEYGFMPTMQMYLLEGPEKKRPAVLIVPGGGYTKLCTASDGEKTAMQYNAAGFHAAILSYSVEPHHFPEPQRNLMSAIRMLREKGDEWGIHKEQIAIIGFSSGGHLCASVSTLWYLAEENAELYRPNAAILCQAILTTRLNHCRDFLKDHAGGDEEKLKLAACDQQVSPYTPPTFLYGTFEDKLTNPENVIYYAEKLCRHGVPFECHIFPRGGHGAPWCDDTIWAKPVGGRDYNYIRLSVEWMRELFGLL